MTEIREVIASTPVGTQIIIFVPTSCRSRVMLICRLILAFWLILSYDLWEDRCVSDVTLMNNFWWKICCDRLKNRTGRFGCCCKLSSVKKCKKITASLILLKRGLEFKTKLKKRRSKKSWKKKHGKNSQILHILIYTRLSFFLCFHLFHCL